jgi:hopanoid biosynthesis associated RND transporter like protein HpnN
LRVNTDTSAMLDEALPFQQRAKALREAFPEIKTDIAVIVKAPTLDETEAFAAALRERALQKPELFQSVFAPSSDPFFRQNGLLYLDTDELESRLAQMTKASGLIETLSASPDLATFFDALRENDALAGDSDLGRDSLSRLYAEFAEVAEASVKAETRPFDWTGAIGGEEAQTHTRLLYMTPTLDPTRLQPAKPALRALAAEIETLKGQFGDRVETYVTGDPALRADELSAVTNGIGLSFAISILSVGALLLLCFRSLSLAFITLAALIMSIVFTAAFAAQFVGALNLVSVAFTVLLVGLGIDYAVHLVLHAQERRGAGLSLDEALKGAVHEVGPGLVLAVATTMLGFFAFIPTPFKGIAQLGLVAGVGVFIALVVAITFIPAALGVFGLKGRKTASRGQSHMPGALAKLLAFATAGAGLLAITLMPQVRFDADPMGLRDPASQSVRGFYMLFEDRNTIPYRLTLLAKTPEEAEAMVAKAGTLDVVGGVRRAEDFIPADQDEKLELISFAAGSLAFALDAAPTGAAAADPRPAARALAERLNAAWPDGSPARRLAAALVSSDEEDDFARLNGNVFRYWPDLKSRLADQFAADYVDEETLPDGVAKRYLSAGGLRRIDLLPKEDVRDPAKLRRFVDEATKAFPEVAGGAAQTEMAGRTIAKAMIEASALALGLIAIFLWVLMRRFSDVLLMLFPLGLAAVLTAAAGVVFNIPFNYANVIVLPLLLGIGIDSGIHLVLRQRHADLGESAFGHATPRAVLFSTLTTVASFGSLMLSPHRGTASMGELLSIAIAFTLLCTLFVLPVAYRLAHRAESSSGAR